MKTPTIYAVSGPAGVGKTTTLDGIKALRPDVYQPFRPTYPRDRGPKLGAFSQSIYDYQAILYATIYNEDVYCDRFLVDRIVYRWFDNGKADPMDVWYNDLKNSWTQLKITAIREANSRLEMNVRMQPECEINFLLLDTRTIQLQRNLTGKQYPFDAALERGYFEAIYETLSAYPINGIRVVKDGVYHASNL